MRDDVRAAVVPYSTPFEGNVPWMYVDVRGLVTTAIGVLIDPVAYALTLPWQTPSGDWATRGEVEADFAAVQSDPKCAKYGHLYAQSIARLRLTPEGVQQAVNMRLGAMDTRLSRRFPEWETWPADAQLAVVSLAWACGPDFAFPKLEKALKAQDWETAAKECRISEVRNPGVRPRNDAQVALFTTAFAASKLDPMPGLVWPRAL